LAFIRLATPSRVLMSRFFFHSYALHRDLHSFPTRRSSDLPNEPCHPRSPTTGRTISRHALGRGRVSRAVQSSLVPRSDGPTQPADRKSTRLKSSHVKISYAVFCLKKKKNTPEYSVRLKTLL